MSECRVTDLDPIPALPYWTLAVGFLAVKGTRLEVTMNCYNCSGSPKSYHWSRYTDRSIITKKSMKEDDMA